KLSGSFPDHVFHRPGKGEQGLVQTSRLLAEGDPLGHRRQKQLPAFNGQRAVEGFPCQKPRPDPIDPLRQRGPGREGPHRFQGSEKGNPRRKHGPQLNRQIVRETIQKIMAHPRNPIQPTRPPPPLPGRQPANEESRRPDHRRETKHRHESAAEQSVKSEKQPGEQGKLHPHRRVQFGKPGNHGGHQEQKGQDHEDHHHGRVQEGLSQIPQKLPFLPVIALALAQAKRILPVLLRRPDERYIQGRKSFRPKGFRQTGPRLQGLTDPLRLRRAENPLLTQQAQAGGQRKSAVEQNRQLLAEKNQPFMGPTPPKQSPPPPGSPPPSSSAPGAPSPSPPPPRPDTPFPEKPSAIGTRQPVRRCGAGVPDRFPTPQTRRSGRNHPSPGTPRSRPPVIGSPGRTAPASR